MLQQSLQEKSQLKFLWGRGRKEQKLFFDGNTISFTQRFIKSSKKFCAAVILKNS